MKILNFGSLNLDFVYQVDHFVRPGETMASMGYQQFCGGKGLNQSIALAKAGAPVWHAGLIGENGAVLKKTLEQYGVHTTFVRPCPGSNGHAIIQVDSSGQNCILLFGGSNQQITAPFMDEVFTFFEPGDILLLQNELNVGAELIERAHRQGMRIALNPSPMAETILEWPLGDVEWFLLNELEGCELAQLPMGTEPDAILAQLVERYPNVRFVLTLGHKGVQYRGGNATASHGIYRVQAVDTTAAGDTFTGYFLTYVAEGKPVADALAAASAASALAVTRQGAAVSIPARDEVEHHTLSLA